MSKHSTAHNSCQDGSEDLFFAKVPIIDKITHLKCGLLKTYASLIGHSILADGKRITRATNQDVANHTGMNPRSVSRNIAAIQKIGLLKTDQPGRSRVIELTVDFESGQWVKLDVEHPTWQLPENAFKVWFGLRRFKGKNREVFAKNETIAKFLNMSVTQVKEGLQVLSKSKFIYISKQWHGCKWASRKIYFPVVSCEPRQNPAIEEMGSSEPRQNPAIEEMHFEGGQNPASTLDKTRPLPWTKPGLYPRQNPAIEKSIKKNSKRTPKHTAHAYACEAGESFDGGVCEGEDKYLPSENQSQSQLGSNDFGGVERQLDRLKNESETKHHWVLPTRGIEIERAIRVAWSKYGPMPFEFLANCLGEGIDKNTLQWKYKIIENLKRWSSYSDEEKSRLSDLPFLDKLLENRSKPKHYSKFNGAERIQCPDGQWRDKAKPAENGAGRDAKEVNAEQGGFEKASDELEAEIRQLPQEWKDWLNGKNDRKFCEQINGKLWIKRAECEHLLSRYRNGEGLPEKVDYANQARTEHQHDPLLEALEKQNQEIEQAKLAIEVKYQKPDERKELFEVEKKAREEGKTLHQAMDEYRKCAAAKENKRQELKTQEIETTITAIKEKHRPEIERLQSELKKRSNQKQSQDIQPPPEKPLIPPIQGNQTNSTDEPGDGFFGWMNKV